MRERIRADFQLGIVSLFGFCSAAVISPFAVYRFLTGAIAVGVLDTVLVISIVAIVLYAWRSGKTELAGRCLVVINCLGAVISSELLGVIGVFWMYAAILSNFFLTTSRRYAAGITIATLLLLAGLGEAFDSRSQMWSFLATSSLLALLSFIVAYRYDQQRRQLEVLATIDPLTGVQNRRMMVQELQRAVQQQQRSGQGATVILLDLDHFKRVNDQFGHETGDAVLHHFAQLVQRLTRQGDRFFRYGGEEFVLLVPESEVADGQAIAEKVRQQLLQEQAGSSLPVVTLSAGVASLRANESWQSWLARADDALYAAKAGGRNRTVLG